MIQAAGIIFLSPQGRVLLLQRSSEGDMAGTWAFPGGKLEAGESPEKAAVRECVEETGYRPGTAGDLLMTSRKGDIEFTTFVKRVDEEFIPKLNEEHTAWGWVSPGEILA